MTAKEGKIRIGIGGWTFAPWRGSFYPKGLPHARELAYTSARLTSIEVNGTFYYAQAEELSTIQCRTSFSKANSLFLVSSFCNYSAVSMRS